MILIRAYLLRRKVKMKTDLCEVCGSDRNLDDDITCPICGESYRSRYLRIFKHEGEGHWIGSCVVVSATNQEIAEQFIRHLLDNAGLTDEELDVHEVKHATTQSSLILMVDGQY